MTRMSVRKIKLCATVIFLHFFCLQTSFAYTLPDHSGKFFGVGAGWVWPTIDGSTTASNGSGAPPPGNVDNYSISHPATTQNFSAYAGYRFIRASRTIPNYSLAFRYQHINGFDVHGMVDQYSLPNYNNYNYSLNVASDVFSLEGKAELYQFGPLAPYVLAGFGLASNNVSSYNEQAVSGIMPRTSPAFGSNSCNNAMFNLGVGIDYQFTQKFWASLGYEYANLGPAETGNGNGANWGGEFLSLGVLKSSTVLLSLFYQLS